MNRFDVSVTLVCPSNWTAEECRGYMERICATKEERDSLSVTPRAPMGVPLDSPDYCKALPLPDGLTFPESGFPLSARMPIPPPIPADRQQFEILVLRALAVILENTPVHGKTEGSVYREIMERLKR